MRVVLGNRAVIIRTAVEPDQEAQREAEAAAKAGRADVVREGRRPTGRVTELVRSGPSGKQATVIDVADGTPLSEAFVAITNPAGVWAYHAAEGKSPAWVASDSEGLAALLAEHFGGIPVRELEDPYAGRLQQGTGGRAGRAAAKAAGSSALLTLMLTVAVLAAGLYRAGAWLKTNAGNDFQANQMAGTPSATAIAKYVALTVNTTAPAATDTTLTGEITTAGGGLVRKAGTYAHTTGAASYTVTTVFTANGTDALPVTIGKRGVFDAASGGNLVFSTLVTPTATLSASGDQLTLTDTVTL